MQRPIPYSQRAQSLKEAQALRQRFQDLGTPRQWAADAIGAIGMIVFVIGLVFLAAVLPL